MPNYAPWNSRKRKALDKPAFTPQSEASILRVLLVAASDLGARLFRNSRGVERIAQKDCKSCQRFGRVVSYGLHNGAPDLVGWLPVTVTPEMVGTKLAVFVGIEAKRETGGTVSEAQARFLAALQDAGALAGVCRSVVDLEAVLQRAHSPLPVAIESSTTGE